VIAILFELVNNKRCENICICTKLCN